MRCDEVFDFTLLLKFKPIKATWGPDDGSSAPVQGIEIDWDACETVFTRDIHLTALDEEGAAVITLDAETTVLDETDLWIRSGVWAALSLPVTVLALWVPELVSYAGVGAITLGFGAACGLAGWVTGRRRQRREVDAACAMLAAELDDAARWAGGRP